MKVNTTKMGIKNWLAVSLVLLLMGDMATRFVHPEHAYAQTGNSIIILGVASSAANCVWPTGGTITNGMAICPISSGGVNSLAIAINGGAFSMLTQQNNGPNVSSWNSLTGAVVYNPSTIACTTASHTNTGFTASGCVIK